MESSPLTVPTDRVELSALTGGRNPSQTVKIGTAVPNTVHKFTASASSPQGWLNVNPFSDAAPAMLTVSADLATLSGAGTYNGFVLITSLQSGEQETVPVRLIVAQQAIVSEPASLTFVQQQAGVAPPSKTIEITANTRSSFTVTRRSSWIQISPSASSTPATLIVTVDPSGLTPGEHKGDIQITGPDNQLTIPVSLTVAEPAGPTVSPESLSFTYELGSPAPEPRFLTVGSTGAGVQFAASARTDSGANWLSVSPASGTPSARLTVRINTASVVPGRQTGTITVASADGAVRRSVAVTLNVATSKLSVNALLHAATLAPTPIAPGQMITITGEGLGPAVGVSATVSAAGTIDSRLGGTRVLFDGIPAPLLYVREDQVNAIVPYAMYGRTGAPVQVEFGGSFSMPVEARVVGSAPGIFTTAGSGQAAAWNADSTPNSTLFPARRGSIVTILGTGEGQTDPAGQDGRVIMTDLRRPVLRATARIAGRTAEVTYIGSAPMSVSGIFQANIRVPDDIEAGTVPIEIQIGDAVSQRGVTIAVR